MWACVGGHMDVVRILLDNGANVRQKKKDGWTALMGACREGHKDVVELLLEKGANVGQAQDDGWTALLAACQKGDLGVVKMLLDKGADMGQLKTNGYTSLMYACKGGHVNVIELLLVKGADVGQDEALALIVACKKSNINVVELLMHLIRGAPTTEKVIKHFNSLKTIITVATENDHKITVIKSNILILAKEKRRKLGALGWPKECARALRGVFFLWYFSFGIVNLVVIIVYFITSKSTSKKQRVLIKYVTIVYEYHRY